MYLIDTHVLLWMLFKKEKLSDRVIELINDSDYLVCSVVSLWEISIKQSLGKLEFRQSIKEIERLCLRHGILLLNITGEYCEAIKKLPPIHSDPFDRMIIAQAMTEKLTIITKDEKIHQYPVSAIW